MAIFLIAGASGSGKTSIAHKLKDEGVWAEVISHTSRPMRDGEVDGETYYFTTEEEFLDMLKSGIFVEHVEYNGNHYGVSKKEVRNKLKNNRHIFVIVEHEGYKQVKKLYPKAVGIFIYATKLTCMSNMLSRGDELIDINERMNLYNRDISNMNEYDFVVYNHSKQMDKTIEEIKSIVSKFD